MKATLWSLGSGFWVWREGGMDGWRRRSRILKDHDLRHGAGSLGLEALSMRPRNEGHTLDRAWSMAFGCWGGGNRQRRK